jgi:hypothetical protein
MHLNILLSFSARHRRAEAAEAALQLTIGVSGFDDVSRFGSVVPQN